MNGETWRVVSSAASILVSSEGRSTVAPSRAQLPNGGFRQYGGMPHSGTWDKQDARFITVLKGKTYKIARLVCEAFQRTAPFEGAVVLHWDENAAKDQADNLQWGTQKENLHASGFLKYRRARTGSSSPGAQARAKRESAA